MSDEKGINYYIQIANARELRVTYTRDRHMDLGVQPWDPPGNRGFEIEAAGGKDIGISVLTDKQLPTSHPLEWTRDHPTASGAYILAYDSGELSRLVCVYHGGKPNYGSPDLLYIGKTSVKDIHSAWWYGPIPEAP